MKNYWNKLEHVINLTKSVLLEISTSGTIRKINDSYFY